VILTGSSIGVLKLTQKVASDFEGLLLTLNSIGNLIFLSFLHNRKRLLLQHTFEDSPEVSMLRVSLVASLCWKEYFQLWELSKDL
jgi:hypothetical protein